MVEVLERIVREGGSVRFSERKEYLEEREYPDVSTDIGYSTFAEMYLEKPIDVQAGLTCTSCTWRGVSTIDDW
ncbi:hypothetical protein HY450_02795 [Candidatus Pacearchaeota archaeon]|nr:hypothetical protein [Candidatus Pacearchaeota archaeon]